jgi:maleate cis-trans isomerase
MYGWRGRIGHVYPAVVAETYFTDFFRVVPEGVTLAMTNLSIQAIRAEDLKRSEAQLDQAIGFLAKRKVDCIIIGGGPIFREKGVAGELEFIARVSRSTGIPTTTSQVATVDAVRHLGIKHLAIATPYPDDQNEKIAQYWRASGFDVGAVKGMGRQIDEIQDIPLDAVYRHVKNTFLASPGAEGVFVPCGQFTVPHIAELEADIGAPVVTGTYAHVWAGLRMIKIKAEIRGHGRLLETVAD